MADRSFQEDVLVRLDTILPRGDGALASRNLKLNRQRDVIIIGRSSKRRTSLGASTSNACYDCPVMSRSHAELKLDTDKKRILLRDIGSLHGTLLNKSRLRNEEPQVLKDGDIITFGMQVERGSERYAPYEVKAGITWQPPRSANDTVTYRVPDETDVEDNSSDDCNGPTSARKVTRESKALKIPTWRSMEAQIDLTENDDEVAPTNKKSTINDKFIDLTNAEDYQSDKGPVGQTRDHHSDAISADSLLVGYDEDKARLGSGLTHSDEPNFWMEDGEDTSSIGSSDDAQELESFEDEDGHDPEGSLSDEEDEVEFAEHDDFEDDFGDDFEDEFEEEPLIQTSTSPPRSIANLTSGSRHESTHEPEQLKEADALHIINTALPFGGIPEHVAGGNSAMIDATTNQQPTHGLQEYHVHGDFFPGGAMGSPSKQVTTLPSMAAIDQSYTPPVPMMSQQDMLLSHFNSKAPTAAVDTLSKKTGKTEYFQARAENRRTLGFPTTSVAATQDSPEEQGHVQATNSLGPDVELFQTPEDLAQKSQNNLSNELVKSGDTFLNTPPTQAMMPEPSARTKSPVLDDTSAYQFELSKKAAAKMNQSEGTTSRNSEDKGAANPGPTPALSPKRKAKEISESTPEEERAFQKAEIPTDHVLKEPRHIVAQGLAPRQPTLAHFVHETTQKDLPRPTKRIRRAAEVFGYAALGGLAVVSALIATAPEL